MTSKKDEPTSVDLGDDLLEEDGPTQSASQPERVNVPDALRPAHTSQAPGSRRSGEVSSLADRLHSARILINEDLIDDAKRLLRSILIVDPGCTPARQLLAEVHAGELKRIFSDDPEPKHRRHRRESSYPFVREAEELERADSEEVVRVLDRDLGLGLFPEGPECDIAGAAESALDFEARLERKLHSTGASSQDRLDLGIAFVEMGLFGIGSSLFSAALRQLSESLGPGEELTRSAASLLASAQIAAGKSYEATQTLQSFLRDGDVSALDKIDFIYLMGVAYEALGKREAAIQWYGQVLDLDPGYRDAATRRKRISGQ